MTETFQSFAAKRWGVTEADVQNLLSLRELLVSRQDDHVFHLGLQAWGAIRGRAILRLIATGTEVERWTAFGKAEETLRIDDTLKDLVAHVKRTEDAFERDKVKSAPPEVPSEFDEL